MTVRTFFYGYWMRKKECEEREIFRKSTKIRNNVGVREKKTERVQC